MELPFELEGGLRLRWGRPQDADALADFNGRVHGDDDGFNPFVAVYSRDLLSPANPLVGPGNVTLVEEVRPGGRIVSSLCLIAQTWEYAGVPFGVGRVEAVGTHPDYRRRGLVRRQMEAIHAHSERLGHLVQAITGIPWYYRQFGYEYALDLGGGRVAPFDLLPPLIPEQDEPYRLRPLTVEDIPVLIPLWEQSCARSLVSAPRSAALWDYVLTGHSPGSFLDQYYRMIESAAGEPLGYLIAGSEPFGQMFLVVELELKAGISWRVVMPGVLRALRRLAEAHAARLGRPLNALYFNFGREHPLFTALPEALGRARPPYAWYLRAPDLPAFLRRIAPALETRLEDSPLAGHTGELKIHEYQSGFRIRFEAGRLVEVAAWRPRDGENESAAFPPRIFLQLLFGFRSLAELRATFPDCSASDEAEVLLNSLFPRRNSRVGALS